MRAAVIIFPGSNCDRDIKLALQKTAGFKVTMVWHGDSEVPKCDAIILPGGFSFGDYLRCGAIAARTPIMRCVVEKAKSGVPVLGVCNGFQILCELGLLPGSLMRNSRMLFVCRDVYLKVENTDTPFTGSFEKGDVISIPVAHHDGNFFAMQDTLNRLEGEGLVVLRYSDEAGAITSLANPNGAQRNIAGICSSNGRVVGMMPHPERACEMVLGNTDGKLFFKSLKSALTV